MSNSKGGQDHKRGKDLHNVQDDKEVRPRRE